MADKPLECLHCALVEALNRHAEAYGRADNADILWALARVTTQILRDAMGADQYPEGGRPPDGAVKH